VTCETQVHIFFLHYTGNYLQNLFSPGNAYVNIPARSRGE